MTCPNIQNHTSAPELQLQWASWARRMSKTHKQIQCSDCGLWVIWVPKSKRKK